MDRSCARILFGLSGRVRLYAKPPLGNDWRCAAGGKSGPAPGPTPPMTRSNNAQPRPAHYHEWKRDARPSRDLRRSTLAQGRASLRAPEGFASSVMSRVASREASRSRRWFLPAFNVASLRPALAAVALVVMVVAVGTAYVHHSTSHYDSVEMADASQSFVDELVLSHQDVASADTGAEAGILLTRYSPANP